MASTADAQERSGRLETEHALDRTALAPDHSASVLPENDLHPSADRMAYGIRLLELRVRELEAYNKRISALLRSLIDAR